jgi:hypothetical protein
MAEHRNAKALELLADADEYLVLTPNENDPNEWTYVWVVADEERKAAFQQVLRKFAEEGELDG